MPSAGGLSVNWGGGGGPFNFGKYLDSPRPDPLRQINQSNYYDPSYYSHYNPAALGIANANRDRNILNFQGEQSRMNASNDMRNALLQHMMGMQRDAFGATANMSTNRQIDQAERYLAPAVENARQGTITGGISNDEYDRGISDARQRAAAQGRAIQGAISSALAQRGVVNPLAGMIAGMKSQFESGRAAGAARADYDKARQQGRIAYSSQYGGLANSQADVAMRPTQENALMAMQSLLGMKPKRKFNPEYL